jgi:hypothetical protein
MAGEVPVALVKVTLRDATPLRFPETVNGKVKLNWLPYCAEAEF